MNCVTFHLYQPHRSEEGIIDDYHNTTLSSYIFGSPFTLQELRSTVIDKAAQYDINIKKSNTGDIFFIYGNGKEEKLKVNIDHFVNDVNEWGRQYKKNFKFRGYLEMFDALPSFLS
tara:strand:+ start:426 stop:773 length:348 start_codon:yes stop_codon:yes gene_type:complete